MSTLSTEPRQAAPPKSKSAPTAWSVLLMMIAAFNLVWIVASPFNENQQQRVHDSMVRTSALYGGAEEARKLEESHTRRRLTNAIALQSAWVCLTVSVAGLAMGSRRD